MQSNHNSSLNITDLVRIRAITAFISLTPKDFDTRDGLNQKISDAKQTLDSVKKVLQSTGFEVQTMRIATNPFGEYLTSSTNNENIEQKLAELNTALEKVNIDFFAIGPAKTTEEVDLCPIIVSSSHRISCSAAMRSGDDVIMAQKAAECMKIISKLGTKVKGDHVKDGLGNFRFCVTASCKSYTPFFPAAMGPSSSSIDENSQAENKTIPFAIGLENGKLAKVLLESSSTLDNINQHFKNDMADALRPIQDLCEDVSRTTNSCYMGMDTSLNPSLDENGSVAEAIEQINIVQKFGGPGSIAVAAEITKALKSLPDIKLVGYCGLMLPVCEDRRLASLASSREIDTTRLLAISSVCGVGLDTIPVPDCEVESLTSLILDVASLSFRYEKSLSCRLLICPGSKEGDETTFNSPYMCECKIFDV